MARANRDFQTARKRKISQLRIAARVSVVALLFVAPALAQSHLQTPPPAAYGPSYDVSFGYSYLLSEIPSTRTVNLNGLAAAARVGFSPRWGVAVDGGYVRNSDILGTGHSGYVLTLLAGPAFYPVQRKNTRLFVHGLVGAGLVDGAVPTSSTTVLHGWVERPAYALGGGIEHPVIGPFGLRLTGDYLHTTYVDSSEVVHMQNNLRVTASLVFRLHEHAR